MDHVSLVILLGIVEFIIWFTHVAILKIRHKNKCTELEKTIENLSDALTASSDPALLPLNRNIEKSLIPINNALEAIDTKSSFEQLISMLVAAPIAEIIGVEYTYSESGKKVVCSTVIFKRNKINKHRISLARDPNEKIAVAYVDGRAIPSSLEQKRKLFEIFKMRMENAALRTLADTNLSVLK